MVRNNTTGGVLMRKSNLLSIFILILAGMLSVPCFLTETIAQDRMPVCSPLGKTAKRIKPLREMNWANDTINVQVAFPAAFRETGRNEIIDSIALLAPVFEHLRRYVPDSPKIQSASFILAIATCVDISIPKPPVPVWQKPLVPFLILIKASTELLA